MSLGTLQAQRNSQIEEDVLKKAAVLWDELDKAKPKAAKDLPCELQYPLVKARERRDVRGMLNFRCVKARSAAVEFRPSKRSEVRESNVGRSGTQVSVVSEEIPEEPHNSSKAENKREVWTTRIVPFEKKKKRRKSKRTSNQPAEERKRRRNRSHQP
eukprot:TRINITY_DN3618_c0_g1_i1.p3 TRINITY_DN3618_c0_g1~~TRINITY_DN3618_c0_g1_i1.p3  ORF type:complete len:157 (+),score=37.13 TRINITY_DN3618_c0_g1_i1:261-731(+)